MLDLEEWRILLANCTSCVRNSNLSSLDNVPDAWTFNRATNTHSGPALMGCSDGKEYWLKGRPDQLREIFIEQIVGSLGIRLGAPVPPITLVKLPRSIRDREARISHFDVGYVHGSQNQTDCTDRMAIAYADQPENRPRFAAIAVLYTWTQASDHQFIYKKQAPNLAFSYDHGLFCGGGNWNAASLAATPPITALDPVFGMVKLTPDELLPFFDALETIELVELAAVIAAPPESWRVSTVDRAALCQYLERRREELLQLKPITK